MGNPFFDGPEESVAEEAAAEDTAETPHTDADGDFFKEEAPAPKGKGEKPATVPQARLTKEIAKRRAEAERATAAERDAAGLREKLAATQAKLETLEPQAASITEIAKVYGERYASREDPAGLLAFDANLMNMIEEAVKTDAGLAAAIAPLAERANKGEKATVPENTIRPTTPEAEAVDANAPAGLSATEKALLTKEIRRTIDEALPEVKPQFRRLAAEGIIHGKTPLPDLAAATPEQLREHAASVFTDGGWERGDVLIPADENTRKSTKAKPNTDAGAGVDTAGPEEHEASEDAESEAPKFKNREEWQAHRERKMRSFRSKLNT